MNYVDWSKHCWGVP